MKTISPKGTLSPQELQKSIRDYALGSAAIAIPEIINMINITDFGQYTFLVQAILMFVVFANRKYNWFRV